MVFFIGVRVPQRTRGFDHKHFTVDRLNGLRFSNDFVEKRSSSFLKALRNQGFFFFDDFVYQFQNSQIAKLIFLRICVI